MNLWQNFLSVLESIGVKPGDNDDIRLQKLILVKTSVLICAAAIIWGIIYLTLGKSRAGLIPLLYAFLSIFSLFFLKISKNFEIFRFSQFTLILLLPFLLMIDLGGFVNGSAVILWALLAPVGALLSGQLRQAIYWFAAFIILVILSGLLQPYMNTQNNLSAEIINLFFTINIITVTLIIFIVLNYFVKHKDKVIKLMHQNRELENSRREKETLLRESDKLATLGRLSAGIAHELNNPASVTLHSTGHLQKIIPDLKEHIYKLGQLNLSEKQFEIYNFSIEKMTSRSRNQIQLNPLTRSDEEDAIESWLKNQKIKEMPQMASVLVELGLKKEELKHFAKDFTAVQLPVIFQALYATVQSNNLLEEISKGTERIKEIIKSLKSYSYHEEAPQQLMDIHEGLNDTLVIMRNSLKSGVDVQLRYTDNLPLIEARSTELVQVWTNIIDNAITAMNGKGKIEIKTFRENDWIVVRISDSGPGITKDIKDKIFNPFFTTKLPGEGTGLGLSISYDIIVNRHHGKINVKSKPGQTCFEIKLPLNNETSDKKIAV